MASEYASLFGHYRDSVIVIEDDAVVYANAAATRIVGVSAGMNAFDVFPKTIFDTDCEWFSCALDINNTGFSTVVTISENRRIITLYELEHYGYTKQLLNTIGSKLKSSVAEIKMASGIMTPYIENTDEEKIIHYNQIINKTSHVLQRMIGNMTYLCGGESGTYLPCQTNLNELIRGIAESAAVYLGKEAPCIKFVPWETDLSISCDREKIEFAIMQLLANSLKNTPQDGEIVLKAGKIKDWAVVEVSDNGYGIREDMLSDVWSISGESGEKLTDGVGTGLPIVQSIARLHGGMAILVSTPDKGTKVSIMLPIKIKDENTLNSVNIKYESGLENMMVQLSEVIPVENFSGKFMD